jgi:hypothetical protein
MLISLGNRFFAFFIRRNTLAITIWPLILLRNKELKNDARLVNHEKIHLKQQLELLIIPFYLLYILEFLFQFIKQKKIDAAYRSISFEREAYTNDANPGYLKSRKIWAMWRP